MLQNYLLLGYEKVMRFGKDLYLDFDRNTLEETLVPHLLSLTKDKKIGNICIVSGPGGFTNLRVASLICNLLSNYFPDIGYITIDKISLYTKLFALGFLPRFGLVYIGQKKNVWHYDLLESKYSLVPKDSEFATEKLDIFLDPIDDYFDSKFETSKISYSLKDGELFVVYQDKSIGLNQVFDTIQSTKIVDPHYMVEFIS